ncbi:MAG: EAL domain-containing protein [Pacificimonas sp.]
MADFFVPVARKLLFLALTLAHRISLRLLAVQAILLAAVVALTWGLSNWLMMPMPAWAFLLAVVVVGIVLGIGAQVSVDRTIRPVTGAICEIEDSARNASLRMERPQFSRSARNALPEVTAAIDRAVDRISASYHSMIDAALTDGVTGLPNRKHFMELVEAHISQDEFNTECALLFIDLDQFKAVNDSLGHAMGDELLRAFARRVSRLLRHGSAAFARLAGDEFTILLPGSHGVGAARSIATRLLTALEEPFRIGDHRLTIGASIGICYAPENGSTLDTLMRNADTAMYRAKAAGRNQAQVFQPEMHEEARERLNLESGLRSASKAGEFTLDLQPQLCCRSGKVIAAEALIRWNHPQRGLLLPGEFIEIAEETGLIEEIGAWVFSEAIAVQQRLASAGVPIRMSANVSMYQMASPKLMPYMTRLLKDIDFDPSQVEVEITESLLMAGDEDIVHKLEYLRALGITIAVDDFGTGYSNLARLKALPIDKIKIDRSLIADIATSATSRTIVQSIISLVHGLGCTSVAEGVETDMQRDILTVMGCEIIQGYGIARPMSEAAFSNWARQAQPDSPSGFRREQ